MDLRVVVKGLEGKSDLHTEAETRVATTLGRFRERIQSMVVLLEDETGPNKQAIDKRCRIDVHLKRGGDLTIDEVGADVLASLAVALGRVKAAIGRKVGMTKRGVGAG